MNDSDEARMRELEKKVDQFERVMRWFVSHPFISGSPSFAHLIEEMGYTLQRNSSGGIVGLIPPQEGQE